MGVAAQLDRAASLREESSRILQLRADLALAENQLSEAGAHILAARRLEPDAAEPWFLQARLDLQTGQETRALGSLAQAIARSPSHRPSLLARALIGSQIGDPRSTAWMEEAERAWPDHPDTHRVAALVQLENGNLEQARAELEAALQARPRDTDLRILAAGLQLQMGDFTEARTTAERAVSLNPNLADAWYLAALAADLDGDPDRADQRYRQALNVSRDDEIIRLLIEQQILAGRALDDPIRETLSQYHLSLARSYRERNLTQRALESYRRALQLYPGLYEARLERAELLRLRGFESTYTAELEVVSRQAGLDAETARNVATQLEIYRARVSRGVAANWDVDQFTLDRTRLRIAVIPQPDSLAALPGRADAISRALVSRLNRAEHVEAVSLPAVGDPVAAIRAAQGAADFLVTLQLSPGDPAVASAQLLNLATAAPVAGLISTRSGLDRVDRALTDIAGQLLAFMPMPLRLVQRRADTGLITGGLADGLDVGQRFQVVEAPGPQEFPVPEPSGRILGTAEIRALDDLVSEVVIEPRGLVDRVRPGSALLQAPEPPPGGSAEADESDAGNGPDGGSEPGIRPDPSPVAPVVASLRQASGEQTR